VSCLGPFQTPPVHADNDTDGAPVTLPNLLKYRVIHTGAHLADTSHLAEETDSLLLDPHSPFPLLQHIEHPVTGDIAWSVHPCQVAVAVEEVLTAESEEQERAADANGSRGGEEDATGAAARQLRWLECWMMLSSGVVDLSA
jgi:metal transporter CNNM